MNQLYLRKCEGYVLKKYIYAYQSLVKYPMAPSARELSRTI
jgi:hypothetical protein